MKHLLIVLAFMVCTAAAQAVFCGVIYQLLEYQAESGTPRLGAKHEKT